MEAACLDLRPTNGRTMMMMYEHNNSNSGGAFHKIIITLSLLLAPVCLTDTCSSYKYECLCLSRNGLA